MNASLHIIWIPALALFASVHGLELTAADGPWPRHVIDRASKGADGVRLADANSDGMLDVVTGWEEGGKVRLCFNPGPARVRGPWPSVTVGSAPSVEDAVLVDLDGDGRLDVVSASEGKIRALHFHWAPAALADLQKPEAWQTQPLGPSRGKTCWMFTLPLQIDGQFGIDLLVGSKNPDGVIGWFQSPKDPRLSEWSWHPLRSAGWVMSLMGADMDGDGDLDLLFSDRKGPKSGCYWLERPADPNEPWPEHLIGAAQREVMFINQADLNKDGRMEVIAAIKPRVLAVFESLDRAGLRWRQHDFSWPNSAGGPKSVAGADLNGDGRVDLVGSCEGAANRSGVLWLDLPDGFSGQPQFHDIGGPEGTKYDLVELIDLDADGDLDVLTCEETENLGVVWYENRLKP